MDISGPFVVALIVAVLFSILAIAVKGWILKLIFFIIALGAVTTTVSIAGLASGWGLLINAGLFIATGVTAFRVKTLGNRIFGIILAILGVALLFPAIQELTAGTTDTLWGTIVSSFQSGWNQLIDVIRRVFGGSA